MATNVIMPVLGMVQESGKIVRWLKAVGDPINEGEILMEIETDKAIQELEAPATGIVGQLLAKEGEDVPVTQLVAVIMSPEEYAASRGDEQPLAVQRTSDTPVPGAASLSTAEVVAAVAASPLAARMASENGIQLSWIKPQGGRIEKADVLAYITEHRTAPSAQRAGKVLASPKARRLAQETQQDLELIHGSGPDGAVIADDVRIGEAKATQASVPAGIPIAPVEAQVSTPVPATNAVWQRMAEHTASSWNAAPHFYLHRTVRATNLLAWHARLPQDPQEKITITDLLVLIASRALLRHPRINVVWENGHIRPLSDIGISLAVAVDEGLVVPVIHGADRLSPAAIAKERNQLVARAQAGRLRVTDISGGSFTISNLGMYGVDSFDAVLNGPQSAILAVGRIMDQVIPVNGAAQVQPVMQLSVSFDHRSIDGATGAKFLSTLCDMVEEPLLLLG